MGDETSKDDTAIEFAMALRHDLVVSLTTDTEGARRLPVDIDSIYAIKALLKDNDSSVISRKRLSTDDATATNNKMAASILERVVANMTIPARDGGAATVTSNSRTHGDKFSPSNLPDFDITAGALSSVGDSVDLDAINAAGRAIKKGTVEGD